jgi:hypothetical protein
MSRVIFSQAPPTAVTGTVLASGLTSGLTGGFATQSVVQQPVTYV